DHLRQGLFARAAETAAGRRAANTAGTGRTGHRRHPHHHRPLLLADRATLQRSGRRARYSRRGRDATVPGPRGSAAAAGHAVSGFPPMARPGVAYHSTWTHPLPGPPRGLSLAREKGALLVWDETHWLYLLNGDGQRQAQRHLDTELAAACLSDDGSACVAV